MQIHCTPGGDHCAGMYKKRSHSGTKMIDNLQSEGFKIYLKSMIKIGLKNGGFSSFKKEVNDRILLITDYGSAGKLDFDAAMEIISRFNAYAIASEGSYNFSSLKANLTRYAELLFLLALQRHLSKNNYNEWFEKKMRSRGY